MKNNSAISEIVMIQPNTSLTGTFIRMLPIGLLYASSKVVAMGLTVHILDLRINSISWQKDLDALITDNTVIVGVSVMSGFSILESLKISRFIRQRYPSIKIVWGGPHPTSNPDRVLEEDSIDYLVRSYGAEPFYQLVRHIINDKECLPLGEIKNLSWRNGQGEVIHNDINLAFEFIRFQDIPYHLIKDFSLYRNITGNEIIFPIYSVMGCPYQCAFCSSPAQYGRFEKKWQPYVVDDVIAHIKMVKERYNASFIYFIDDDSFVDLGHVERIIDIINREGIGIKLGFRGARVNEILLMNDVFLRKLVEAGTNTLHIGAESGSNRILQLMKKNISVEQTLEVNRKLARYPEIKVYYNFIVGFPTETIEETLQTRDLILRLIRENSSCCIIPLNKPRPLPGTELYDLAYRYGYKGPRTLDEWGNYDVESSDYNPVWLSKKHNRLIRMMFLCMYFIDNKIFKLPVKNSSRTLALKAIAFLYKPLADLRFKLGFYQLLLEDNIYSLFKRIL